MKTMKTMIKLQSDLGLHCLHMPFCQTLWCTKFKDIYRIHTNIYVQENIHVTPDKSDIRKIFFLFSLKTWFLWIPTAYEGCSKWIAYFYLETFIFKLAQKYSFHALEVLSVARNAKFQPMYPLLEGVTVRWFWHSNKVLMNGRSKYLSGLVFPPSKECFQFRKQKEITWGKVWGIRGWGKTVTFSFFKNAVTIAEVWAGALSCRRRTYLKPVAWRRFW